MFHRALKIGLLFLISCSFIFLFLSRESLAFFPKTERKIVVFRQDVAVPDQKNLLDRFKITPYKSLRLINAQAVRLSTDELALLQRDPRVLRIDPDVEVFALPAENRVEAKGICDWFPNWPGCNPTPTPTPTPTPQPTPSPSPSPTSSPSPSPSPSSSPSPSPTPGADGSTQTIPWGITRIDADDAWSLSSGLGIKVAVIDTGIDTDHPDLKDNLAGCVNKISSWKTCEDDNGHGTHVSGIIAAKDNNLGVVGVAPNAKIYAVKVLDRRGGGYLSDVIEGLDWAVANQMQVVNMSLGTSSNVTSFHDAVKRVNAAGIVQVAAAGNSGPGTNTVNYPAKYPEVIAIAATDSSDNVPSWSSRGPEIDLAAPGVNINSTYLSGKYKLLSGTSMSAPHVTGVVALRLFLKLGESSAQIEAVLEANRDSLPLDPTLVGAGLVNAYKVVTAP